MSCEKIYPYNFSSTEERMGSYDITYQGELDSSESEKKSEPVKPQFRTQTLKYILQPSGFVQDLIQQGQYRNMHDYSATVITEKSSQITEKLLRLHNASILKQKPKELANQSSCYRMLLVYVADVIGIGEEILYKHVRQHMSVVGKELRNKEGPGSLRHHLLMLLQH